MHNSRGTILAGMVMVCLLVINLVSAQEPASSTARPRPWIRVAADQKGFVLGETDQPFVPWGFNTITTKPAG